MVSPAVLLDFISSRRSLIIQPFSEKSVVRTYVYCNVIESPNVSLSLTLGDTERLIQGIRRCGRMCYVFDGIYCYFS